MRQVWIVLTPEELPVSFARRINASNLVLSSAARRRAHSYGVSATAVVRSIDMSLLRSEPDVHSRPLSHRWTAVVRSIDISLLRSENFDVS